MKLIELIRLASAGWEKTSEIPLTEYLDENGKVKKDADKLGDTLGLFIVREIVDTYDPKQGDGDQAQEALRVMLSTSRELDNVIRELAEAA